MNQLHGMIYLVCGNLKQLFDFLLKYLCNEICCHFYRVLGSVGEPINPEAWLWYYKKIGNSKCSIVDTFWQTETGGHVITPLPGATPMKPGSAVCILYIYTLQG